MTAVLQVDPEIRRVEVHAGASHFILEWDAIGWRLFQTSNNDNIQVKADATTYDTVTLGLAAVANLLLHKTATPADRIPPAIKDNDVNPYGTVEVEIL